MKTFDEVTFKYHMPSWYTGKLHNDIVALINGKGKLHAVKLMRDTEEDHGPVVKRMALHELKAICDYITEDYVLTNDGYVKVVKVPVETLNQAISFVMETVANNASKLGFSTEQIAEALNNSELANALKACREGSISN